MSTTHEREVPGALSATPRRAHGGRTHTQGRRRICTHVPLGAAGVGRRDGTMEAAAAKGGGVCVPEPEG